jgi:acyl-coenzyme A synthetase/AMP-(fatty) acid ligase/acyl carrier protein
LRLFLEADNAGECHSIKKVFCSGEALSWSLRSNFLEKLDCELHNLYGPTEAAVDVSYWNCRDKKYPGKIPIGYPVANTQLYILDKYLQPIPLGVVGELYIGGVQVARGYLNRKDLTNKRFINDPFDKSGKGKLYKTGDLVRFLHDGAIEYIGRNDFQIKLYGNRIELTEIEMALRSLPEIKDALVVLSNDKDDTNQLVAYLITDLPSIDELQIKKHLQKLIPYYMVPSIYLSMKTFPLTVSGKIDRKQLPSVQPHVQRELLNRADQSKETDYIRIIEKMWAQITDADISEIDVDCNFFDSGGTSLQIAELAVAIEKKLGKKVPLIKMFQYPNIAALVEYLEKEL